MRITDRKLGITERSPLERTVFFLRLKDTLSRNVVCDYLISLNLKNLVDFLHSLIENNGIFNKKIHIARWGCYESIDKQCFFFLKISFHELDIDKKIPLVQKTIKLSSNPEILIQNVYLILRII